MFGVQVCSIRHSGGLLFSYLHSNIYTGCAWVCCKACHPTRTVHPTRSSCSARAYSLKLSNNQLPCCQARLLGDLHKLYIEANPTHLSWSDQHCQSKVVVLSRLKPSDRWTYNSTRIQHKQCIWFENTGLGWQGAWNLASEDVPLMTLQPAW